MRNPDHGLHDYGTHKVLVLVQVKAYAFKIVGLPYENRLRYVLSHVKPGDELELVPELDNTADGGAIAAFHKGHKVGYVRHDAYWIHDGFNEGSRFSVCASYIIIGQSGGQALLAFGVPSQSVAANQSARQHAIDAYGGDSKSNTAGVTSKILKTAFMIVAIVFRSF